MVRPKGHIGIAARRLLVACALAPVLVAMLRLLAGPDLPALPGIEALVHIGSWLERECSLQWIPADDRGPVLYLVLLPPCAFAVAFARLTLGLRVLGLRAILLAIGLQAIGVLPGLCLLVLVVALIASLRPWMRRIRLPMYARLPAILCLCSMVMLSALLAGPWIGSEWIHSMAFFPAVIMAMLAEGVARTIEQDDAVMALWRAGWTVLLALAIATFDQPLAAFGFRFPELMLTWLAAIVLLAEYFDLRLLEAWPAWVSRRLTGDASSHAGRLRVAVVRSPKPDRQLPSEHGHKRQGARGSVRSVVDTLRASGVSVQVFDGDSRLPAALHRFLGPAAMRGRPCGLVLNVADDGTDPERQLLVPALMEFERIPYAGPGPVETARLNDRPALLSGLAGVGVPVPCHIVVAAAGRPIEVGLPAMVRRLDDPYATPSEVSTAGELAAALAVGCAAGRAVFVEELPEGSRLSVGVLGNDELECLPPVTRSHAERSWAPTLGLSPVLTAQVQVVAKAAFRAAGCRDWARIDMRLHHTRGPLVVGVRWADTLARRGALATAAAAVGIPYAHLLLRVLGAAARRGLGQWQAAQTPCSAERSPIASALAARRCVASIDRPSAPTRG